MVVNNLDIKWAGRASGPLKTDPPLIVDANAVLALTVTFQRFESVTRQRTNIFKLNSCFQAIKLEPGSAFNSRECFDSFTGREVSGPPIPVADDHTSG
jgi:hypothetical protein